MIVTLCALTLWPIMSATVSCTSQLRQLDAWYRDETERWAAERDQLAKKCAQMEQRHVQFQHELRRKDTEFEKLQKQLAARLGAAAVAGGSARRSVGRSGSSSSGMQATGKLTTSGRWVVFWATLARCGETPLGQQEERCVYV